MQIVDENISVDLEHVYCLDSFSWQRLVQVFYFFTHNLGAVSSPPNGIYGPWYFQFSLVLFYMILWAYSLAPCVPCYTVHSPMFWTRPKKKTHKRTWRKKGRSSPFLFAMEWYCTGFVFPFLPPSNGTCLSHSKDMHSRFMLYKLTAI